MTQVAAPEPETHARLRSPRAWARLIVGLMGYGVSIDLMVKSGLGLGPWDAFHQGLSKQTGITMGMASIAVGFAIVAFSWTIGIRPGVGTLANMVLIGWFIDLFHPLIPDSPSYAWGFVFYAVAVVVCGLSTGLYISAGLGKGPRDGLILGLVDRTRWPVRRMRTLVELAALGCGWWMGGPVGVGTLIFAFTIGPAMQWGLQLAGVHGEVRPATEP
ncbi:MAG TPA: hypothetical protein VF584_13245 [Longimicrobium sp.]|jgi:hypothetical protein